MLLQDKGGQRLPANQQKVGRIPQFFLTQDAYAEEINPADTMILDFQPPGLRQQIQWKPPSLCYLVMTGLRNQHSPFCFSVVLFWWVGEGPWRASSFGYSPFLVCVTNCLPLKRFPSIFTSQPAEPGPGLGWYVHMSEVQSLPSQFPQL